MDDLLILLIVGIFKLIGFVFKTIFRLIRGIFRLVIHQQSGQMVAPRPSVAKPVAPPQPTAQVSPRAQKLIRRLDALVAHAQTTSKGCVREEANQRFCEIQDRYLIPLAKETAKGLAQAGDKAVSQGEKIARQIEYTMRLVTQLIAQRRDEDLSMLVGDADALAQACLDPIRHFADVHGVKFAPRGLVTLVASVDNPLAVSILPGGLAVIELPRDWDTEIAQWPALAHEVGHTIYRALPTLEAELRVRWHLPAKADLPWDEQITTTHILGAAGAWLEEIFADAWGVMMLGPAYVRTMIWAFANPSSPERMVICDAVANQGRTGASFDEHPPAHLRVLLACRLLERMNQHREAVALEKEWRKQHGELPGFFLPTQQGTYVGISESVLRELGQTMVLTLYEAKLDTLDGEALEALPGLDWGPHQEQAARQVEELLLAGRSLDTRDPRHLIAGAVLARFAKPADTPRILRQARAAIHALGVAQHRLVRREVQVSNVRSEPRESIDLLAESILLGAILDPPPSARWVRV